MHTDSFSLLSLNRLACVGYPVWRMPGSGIPYQFYVLVEATDKAGKKMEDAGDKLKDKTGG